MNKIIRIISRVPHNDYGIPILSTNSLYKSLKILKFNDFYNFYLLKFAHKLLYSETDPLTNYLYPLFIYLLTRGVRINLPNVRTTIEKNFVLFRVCKLSNDAENNLLVPQSKYMLKKSYMTFVLSHY